jgi:hypothetical protein
MPSTDGSIARQIPWADGPGYAGEMTLDVAWIVFTWVSVCFLVAAVWIVCVRIRNKKRLSELQLALIAQPIVSTLLALLMAFAAAVPAFLGISFVIVGHSGGWGLLANALGLLIWIVLGLWVAFRPFIDDQADPVFNRRE